MNSKSRRIISTAAVFALVFALLAATPMAGVASSNTDRPFRVTRQPDSAVYNLNDPAIPLMTTFEYDTNMQQSMIDPSGTVRVQWYWSYSNSTTDRSNGQGESIIPYNRQILYPTTLTPPTDTIGVKYYYAVVTYGESIPVASAVSEVVPREAVSQTARIEVLAPKPAEASFRVRKVDNNGNPLAGAVLALTPDYGHASGTEQYYEATSDANGNVTFTATEGAYILSEVRAPTGYNATDEKHALSIQGGAVLEVVDYNRQDYRRYETIVLVNMPIPKLITDDHFAYMVGYPEGTFGPSRNMSRAEAVVMFSRLLESGINLDGNHRNNYYPDVPATAWYSNPVGYMQSLGVLADYSRDGNFRPNEPVTRAEFATLAAHFAVLDLVSTNEFSDVPNDHWAVKYINSAAAKGWILGYIDGTVKTFRPEGNITRAEVVTLVNRMLDRNADSAYLAANLSALPRSFSDLTDAHWAYLAIMEATIGHDFRMSGSDETWIAVYK